MKDLMPNDPKTSALIERVALACADEDPPRVVFALGVVLLGTIKRYYPRGFTRLQKAIGKEVLLPQSETGRLQ